MACHEVRAQGGGAGETQRGAEGTRRARVNSDAHDKRGNQGRKSSRSGGTVPRGRRGAQGANTGTKKHHVSRREPPCR